MVVSIRALSLPSLGGRKGCRSGRGLSDIRECWQRSACSRRRAAGSALLCTDSETIVEWVAALPEGYDELVALLVRVELAEVSVLLIGDDPKGVFVQPFLIDPFTGICGGSFPLILFCTGWPWLVRFGMGFLDWTGQRIILTFGHGGGQAEKKTQSAQQYGFAKVVRAHRRTPSRQRTAR